MDLSTVFNSMRKQAMANTGLTKEALNLPPPESAAQGGMPDMGGAPAVPGAAPAASEPAQPAPPKPVETSVPETINKMIQLLGNLPGMQQPAIAKAQAGAAGGAQPCVNKPAGPAAGVAPIKPLKGVGDAMSPAPKPITIG
jgi:hypothetical protein